MNYQEIMDAPELISIKKRAAAAGVDFNANSQKALDQYYSAQPVKSNSKQEIILFLIDFLEKLIEQQLAKPAKTKGGKILRFLWNIGELLGIVSKARKEAQKL